MWRRKKTEHAGGVAFDILEKLDAEDGLNARLVRLWRQWPRAVGEHLAECAFPLGRREGTLVVGAEDNALLNELTYYAPQLLMDVNAFLGEEIFDKVRFELVMSKTPLRSKVEEILDSPRPAPLPPPPPGFDEATRIDPDSAVGRCRAAYVNIFKQA